jgi:hypothetical protein
MYAATATTVQSNVRIVRERRLPQAGEITVTVGQEVNPVQVVARTSRQRAYTVVRGAELLGVTPDELADYLLVEEGTAIQRKKPILEKRSLLGGKKITSPVNGVLYQVAGGNLILQHTPELFERRAMIHGVVRRLLSNRGVVIEASGALIEGRWASGREGYGTLKLVGHHDTLLAAEHINADVRGAILVAGRIKQLNVLELAEENSTRGVVVGSIPADLVPETSQFRFPIMVTEGFGDLPMSTPIYELLKECEGSEASLLGDIASNWERPEIIIPRTLAESPGPLAPVTEQLREGQQVRLCRAPFMGRVGKIVSVHKSSQMTGAGFRLPGANVKLEDGETVFVPYMNLDMIR